MGTTCVFPELGNLTVHQDHKIDVQGERLHIVSELENMQMDTEPPSEWSQIPPDFQLITGYAGKLAPMN
ncbi:MAG: hypothetical protein LC130_15310 [Bryobacterales bacterium]|nr:hypothetical protein [Bryobacterales bacterium]MEB2362860.1 hypothetical protein [Bryobacterales bacterium]HEU0140936.1 hypothetical protein [Bryobacteraceae bacterium]